MERLADVIALVLKNCWPFTYPGQSGPLYRARIDFDVFKEAKRGVAQLADKAELDYKPRRHGYPHYDLILDPHSPGKSPAKREEEITLEIEGEHPRHFLQLATTSDVPCLSSGDWQPTRLLEKDGRLLTEGTLYCLEPRRRYRLVIPARVRNRVAAWLRALSDGYVLIDPADPHVKLPGPVIVRDLGQTELTIQTCDQDPVSANKSYFIGIDGLTDAPRGEPLPQFTYSAEKPGPAKRPVLYEIHQALGARMVNLAGWEMPQLYTDPQEEHVAVRTAAGLFDTSDMGILEIRGPNARAFLDLVTTNDVGSLKIGQMQYTFMLSPEAQVIDDVMVYRLEAERYTMVLDPVNHDKDWAWLNAVNQGAVCIDLKRPWAHLSCPAEIRDLRVAKAGQDRRIDLAIQGPESRRILMSLGGDEDTLYHLRRLNRTQVMQGRLGGFDLIIARSGYTRERIGYELFVHPDQAPTLWTRLMAAGEPFGLQPIGLAARDSLRIEAGLPLYGHELAGPLDLDPADAGFASYVKTYKPFFIGRRRYMAKQQERDAVIARFRMVERGVRVPQQGDPVVNLEGLVIGKVTSCSIDTEGHLVGQAYIKANHAAPGTPIAMFQATHLWASKPRDALDIGDRVQLHDRGVILSRFMK